MLLALLLLVASRAYSTGALLMSVICVLSNFYQIAIVQFSHSFKKLGI